nr:hypothetical protein [Tanacetum cinerariifolium]
MVEEENNLIETPILKNVYQRRIKSNSKKKNIDSFVCNDYDDSIDEVDPNIIVKEVVKDINKSSVEYTEDNSNDEDNEESHSAEEEHNTKGSDLVKTPTIKKRGRPKKIVRDNENKTSSVKRRGHPRKNNDESKKQIIGSKRKGREYKVEDDDDNEAKVKRKRNQKNNKRKIVDESSSEFEVTTTSCKALFNAMAILNVDRKKCLYEMGFGSLIGMAIHELPGMLGFYVIDNLDTKTNVLYLTDNSILVNSQSVHDILEIPTESKQKWVNPVTHHYTGPLTFMILLYLHCTKFDDFDVTHLILAIKHWKLVQMKHRDKLETEKYGRFGLLPKKEALNLQSEKRKVTPPGFQMESDSHASDDDNQKSDFQVLFHKESGNSDLQRMKNKERNEEVHHILNEDDKVNDSCPAVGVCSVIEVDEVKLSEVEDLEKKQQIGNEDDRVVDDLTQQFQILLEKEKDTKKYSLNECDAVIQDENKGSVERSEHTLEKEKKKISNEELRSKSLKGNVGDEDAVDSQGIIEDIFKQDEQIHSAEDSGNSDLQRMNNKERNDEVHHILTEDDKVDDSCPAAGVCSVIEVDEVKLNSVTEGKGVKFIENDYVLVDDVPNEMIKCSFEVQKKYSLNKCDTVIQDENKDSVERSERTLEKEKKKMSNEELRSESLKGNVGDEDAVDSQDTIEDIFKQDEQIQSAEDVGCSILDLDDVKLDVYNGPDLRSKLDLIFESQSGFGLNHLEMETLTPTLMVSAYVFSRFVMEITFLICIDFNKGSIHLIDNSANGTDHKNQRYKGIPQAIRKVFVQYLYYVKHPKAEAIEKAKIKRMKMSWRTMRNSTDCGVFTMLHMESYIGAEGE